MDDVGRPIQFAHGLYDASIEEDGSVIVVLAEFPAMVADRVFSFGEEIIIINEINLHSGFLDGSHFDDQGVVCVVDDEIHA